MSDNLMKPTYFPWTLHDWQISEGQLRLERDPLPASYSLVQGMDRIDIAFETGEHVWIEKQDGRIRVHCFHPGNDAPVNVEIYGDRIEIDRHDHDAEA